MLRDALALFVCTKCICFAFELSECQRESHSVARLQFLHGMGECDLLKYVFMILFQFKQGLNFYLFNNHTLCGVKCK